MLHGEFGGKLVLENICAKGQKLAEEEVTLMDLLKVSSLRNLRYTLNIELTFENFRVGSGGGGGVRLKFSKVGLLRNLLYPLTVELSFENFRVGSGECGDSG